MAKCVVPYRYVFTSAGVVGYRRGWNLSPNEGFFFHASPARRTGRVWLAGDQRVLYDGRAARTAGCD
jgi:hypothetical protein